MQNTSCWERLRTRGADLSHAHSLAAIHDIVAEATQLFELPRCPEEEAVHLFLDALCGALGDSLVDLELDLPEAAE